MVLFTGFALQSVESKTAYVKMKTLGPYPFLKSVKSIKLIQLTQRKYFIENFNTKM